MESYLPKEIPKRISNGAKELCPEFSKKIKNKGDKYNSDIGRLQYTSDKIFITRRELTNGLSRKYYF